MRPYLVGVLLGLAGLAGGGSAVWWWLGQRAESIRAATWDIPLTAISVPTDTAALVEGERLAWLRGCHG